jgi:hypothetical protein
MRLGDLLVRAKLVTSSQIAEALQLQARQGGRLGDHLVALNAVTQKALDAFLNRMPAEPRDLESTGIDPKELLTLLLKLIHQNQLESVRQFVDAIKLPSPLVMELVRTAVDRKFLLARGLRSTETSLEMSYAMSDEGRRYTLDALQQLRYVGPAPVSLEDFTYQVNLQKLTNEVVTIERIRDAIRDLQFDDTIVEQVGPALNAGRAMLLYGPPGNGKTSAALRLASLFNDVIYVPYAITIDGQVITFYDPSIHAHIPGTGPRQTVSDLDTGDGQSLFRKEAYDLRWIPCRRPFVVAGGELTLEMLELSYDHISHIYEAPLHMKVLGGCFVIDDFGRQLVSPTKLLNRWIVPLESAVDYLKLHSGKSFSIPFDELVIFSTNLEPEDLMDPAFLRRLPYKIEIGAPDLKLFRRIFDAQLEPHGIEVTDDLFNCVIHKIREEKGLPLAAFQPRFIVDQIVATCRFLNQPVRLETRFVDYAIDNLCVRRNS